MTDAPPVDPLVIFTPSGRRGRVPAGTPVLQAARKLGVDLDSVCGGRGICSRCQIAPSFGEFSKQPKVIAATVSSWLQARRPPRVCARAAHAANTRAHPVQPTFVQRPPRDNCDPAASPRSLERLLPHSPLALAQDDRLLAQKKAAALAAGQPAATKLIAQDLIELLDSGKPP